MEKCHIFSGAIRSTSFWCQVSRPLVGAPLGSKALKLSRVAMPNVLTAVKYDMSR